MWRLHREIKPLTEEEKKEKLDELRAAMAIKRAAKAKIDAEGLVLFGLIDISMFKLDICI